MNIRLRNENGQAMVEFALILPILLLILCGIMDFGWLFYNQLSLDNVCREGARYAVTNSSTGETDGIKDKIRQIAVESAISPEDANEMGIDVEYTSPSNPVDGDVKITLSREMKILTYVLGTIEGSDTRTIVSEVTMKVES